MSRADQNSSYGCLIGILVTGTFILGVYFGYVSALFKKYVDSAIQIEQTNIVREKENERFIRFNDERFYSEIDGKPVLQKINELEHQIYILELEEK